MATRGSHMKSTASSGLCKWIAVGILSAVASVNGSRCELGTPPPAVGADVARLDSFQRAITGDDPVPFRTGRGTVILATPDRRGIGPAGDSNDACLPSVPRLGAAERLILAWRFDGLTGFDLVVIPVECPDRATP